MICAFTNIKKFYAPNPIFYGKNFSASANNIPSKTADRFRMALVAMKTIFNLSRGHSPEGTEQSSTLCAQIPQSLLHWHWKEHIYVFISKMLLV